MNKMIVDYVGYGIYDARINAKDITEDIRGVGGSKSEAVKNLINNLIETSLIENIESKPLEIFEAV